MKERVISYNNSANMNIYANDIKNKETSKYKDYEIPEEPKDKILDSIKTDDNFDLIM